MAKCRQRTVAQKNFVAELTQSFLHSWRGIEKLFKLADCLLQAVALHLKGICPERPRTTKVRSTSPNVEMAFLETLHVN